MFIDNYSIRFFKNGKRIDTKSLTPIDFRILYRDLKRQLSFFESYYGKFNNSMIAVRVDDVEFLIEKTEDTKIFVKKLIEKYKPETTTVVMDGYVCDLNNLRESFSTIIL